MAAFNTLDGVPATSSRALLTGTLRDDWGWDGLIVSDYDAVKELTVHGVAADAAEAARMALHAGVDIDLHSGTYLEQLPRSEEHTSELQSLMRISYAVFCLKKKKTT